MITEVTGTIATLLFAFAVTVFTFYLTKKWLENRIELMIELDDQTFPMEKGKIMERLLRFYELQDKYGILYQEESDTFKYHRK